MADKVILGAGSHEPIFHRIRTGHASAGEWDRWHRETTNENLDLLQEVGVNRVLVACTKGFGFEAEKPLIERAANLRTECKKRGMQCDVYVQGLPVYYETFLLERPDAEQWMARNQSGDFYPWGGQTFRRWMDPHSEDFLEYQRTLIRHAVLTVQPDRVLLDNTVMPGISYTQPAVESFRAYLRETYASRDLVRELGIPGFDKVDLPHFNDIYYPPDAYRVAKDPLYQEVCYWRAQTFAWWAGEIRDVVKNVLPEAKFVVPCGCDNLRYNALMKDGVDFDLAIRAADLTTMEESGWRPRVVLPPSAAGTQVRAIQDGRNPDAGATGAADSVRISTDARWEKILSNYGRKRGFGFWGEFEKVDQEIAAAHGLAFAGNAYDFGMIGPLAGNRRMAEHVAPIVAWANKHLDLLDGRDERFCAAAVWRSTATLGFVRHTPVWAACALEQMLFENHLPFTILLDENLEGWLTGRHALFLPMTSCVSGEQAEAITEFVKQGGGLVLLGDAGTRDERTRVRERHAFAEMLPAEALDRIEQAGPPHFVPEVNIGRLSGIIRSEYGSGRVSLIPRMAPIKPLDLTRDPYLPWRQVVADDVRPPANEQEIWAEILWVMGQPSPLRIDGPRHTLCEYWRQGEDLLICCANLHPAAGGGPLTIHLPGQQTAQAEIYPLYEDGPQAVEITGGRLQIDRLDRFVAIRVPGIMRTFGPDRRLAQ